MVLVTATSDWARLTGELQRVLRALGTYEPGVEVKEKEVIVRATGLGGFISSVAGEKDKQHLLAASVMVMSVIPAASTLVPANPQMGLIPRRMEPDPPVTLMSANACPA